MFPGKRVKSKILKKMLRVFLAVKESDFGICNESQQKSLMPEKGFMELTKWDGTLRLHSYSGNVRLCLLKKGTAFEENLWSQNRLESPRSGKFRTIIKYIDLC